jgi:transposase
VPGRKTDYADAKWLAHLLECGLLAGSFVPPAEIKAARDVVRYRTKIVQQRVSEIARLGSTLQDAGIKIDSVAWSIATKSGRAMIEALIDGERRGPVLAQLAKGTMRSKIADLSMAPEWPVGHHALMCRLHLDHIDHLEAAIARLDVGFPSYRGHIALREGQGDGRDTQEVRSGLQGGRGPAGPGDRPPDRAGR